MLTARYIYGYSLNESFLKDLHSTYIACQKYLVHHFSDALNVFVKGTLSLSNCCAFLEQLLQIEEEASSLECVRKFIAINGEPALSSEGFLDISQTTLIHLLQIKHLNTPEVAVLQACFKWIDHQLKLQGVFANLKSRQKLFKPIRGYLRLSDIPAEEYGKIGNLESFFHKAELGDLFLTLFSQSSASSPFPCQTDRVRIGVGSTLCKTFETNRTVPPNELSLKLIVSKFALIKQIHTFFVPLSYMPSIKIYENDVLLPLGYNPTLGDRRQLIIQLTEYFEVHPGRTYKLVFNSKDKNLLLFRTSTNGIFENIQNGSFKFTLSDFAAYHPIEKIEFCFPYETTPRNWTSL